MPQNQHKMHNFSYKYVAKHSQQSPIVLASTSVSPFSQQLVQQLPQSLQQLAQHSPQSMQQEPHSKVQSNKSRQDRQQAPESSAGRGCTGGGTTEGLNWLNLFSTFSTSSSGFINSCVVMTAGSTLERDIGGSMETAFRCSVFVVLSSGCVVIAGAAGAEGRGGPRAEEQAAMSEPPQLRLAGDKPKLRW
ncbi:hypothetical protein SFRURICE_003127 [Spodoptera frugiperda]|nr:hypothetical protein SFRURICE_003127 [Spodoptera frugiperda]